MSADPFDELESALGAGEAGDLFDKLASTLESRKEYGLLFEALLMRKRRDLGLPIQGGEGIRDLPDDVQLDVENFYMDLCRRVGRMYLSEGDIPGAWPYFRSIEEPEEVKRAIGEWKPPDSEGGGTVGKHVEAIIDVALTQGAHPQRGYELLLETHGLERGLRALEQQVPRVAEVVQHCGRLFVNRLYTELVECVRASTQSAEDEPAPDEDLRALLEKHPEGFDEAHLEERYIRGALRAAATLEDADAISRGVEIAEYGRLLRGDPSSPDPAPFEDFYADVRIFLLALLGTGADGAVRYFTAKAERSLPDAEGKHVPGEVLVTLLARLGKYREALEAHQKHLADSREPAPTVPGLLELSRKAGDYTLFLNRAREKNDLLQFVVGLLDRADR